MNPPANFHAAAKAASTSATAGPQISTPVSRQGGIFFSKSYLIISEVCAVAFRVLSKKTKMLFSPVKTCVNPSKDGNITNLSVLFFTSKIRPVDRYWSVSPSSKITLVFPPFPFSLLLPKLHTGFDSPESSDQKYFHRAYTSNPRKDLRGHKTVH